MSLTDEVINCPLLTAIRISRSAAGQIATGTVKATLWGELPSAKPVRRLRANPEYIDRV